MATEYVMPKLAMAMNEGTIAQWVVTDGAWIEQGATIMVCETEKTAYDLESPETGFFKILVAEGETVPVDSPIGSFYADEAELASSGDGGPVAADAPAAAVETVAEPVVAAAPAAAASGGRIKASPLARKMAGQKGLDLSSITGSGPGGRIVKRDVLAAEAAPAQPVAQTAASAATAAAVSPEGIAEKARVPLRGSRNAIAKRMADNLSQMAQVSQMNEVDVTGLLAMRKELIARTEKLGVRVSLNAFFLKAMAVAARQVPIANASIVGDEIILWEDVNIAMAVSLPGDTEYTSNLIAPVIRNVERKGLVEIDRELRDLVERARSGGLKPGETEGATMTFSSTAGFFPGWTVSTPIVNAPQAIIVQPGTVIKKPVVVDDEIVIRQVLPLSLTFDHRVLDGEPYARFTTALLDCIANPNMMLL